MNKDEMKNKYSAFITEISEILGLGKPVDILKLCVTTDLFFQPLEKRIAELEAQIEGKENEFQYFSNSFKIKINNLKAQIEKMKCCSNCKWSDSESKLVHPPCKDCNWDLDKWEIKENDSKAKS